MFLQLKKELTNRNVTLVAVSKTKPVERILEYYDAGQLHFGENKVQELMPKYEALPKDIKWHLIGHLQTNKAKYIAPFIHLIHSVDSFKVLKEINKQAAKHDRVISCLLQFKIAEEDTKYGFTLEEVKTMLETPQYKALENVEISGVMGMATYTDDEYQVKQEFKKLTSIFSELKNNHFSDKPAFKEISMGMSGDYKIALEEGTTIVRIGSLIFGEREYDKSDNQRVSSESN